MSRVRPGRVFLIGVGSIVIAMLLALVSGLITPADAPILLTVLVTIGIAVAALGKRNAVTRQESTKREDRPL